jgi:hypothetical protein
LHNIFGLGEAFGIVDEIKNQPQLSLGRLRLVSNSFCVVCFSTSPGDAHKLSRNRSPHEEAVRKSEIIKASVMHLSKSPG